MTPGWGVFDKVPKDADTIAFGSEVFPMKQFLLGRKPYPTQGLSIYTDRRKLLECHAIMKDRENLREGRHPHRKAL